MDIGYSKRTMVCLAVLVWALFLGAIPAYAQSGSFLDTIYQATEGETDDSGLAPVEESEYISDDDGEEPDGDIKFACPGVVSSCGSSRTVTTSSCGNTPTTTSSCGSSRTVTTSSSCGAAAPVSTGCTKVLTQEQFEQLIRQIIQQIMASSGMGCGCRTIIIRIPCGILPPSGGAAPATPAPQPVSAPSPTPVTPSAPTTPTAPTAPTTPTGTGIAGLKAEMRGKYGIEARDGDAQWSERQLEEANKVLASLPECFRSHTKSIQRDGVYRGMTGVLGYVQMGIPTVHMMNGSCRDGTFQGTLVHEMTHTWQANNSALTNQWQRQFWPNGRTPSPSSVSSYGNTQPVEDMAESVRVYWQNGPAMKKSQPARYEWIKNNIMGGQEF